MFVYTYIYIYIHIYIVSCIIGNRYICTEMLTCDEPGQNPGEYIHICIYG